MVPASWHGGCWILLHSCGFAAEEIGLIGARAYVDLHADELDLHVLAMEADFGAGRVWSMASGVPEDRLPVADAFHAALGDAGIERGGNTSRGGADISRLWRMGVPVLGPRHQSVAVRASEW